MQAFEGEPYGIEWTTDARISHLEMTNDITRPGALPLVDMEIDGQTVSLVLDTGGDRLYLDRDIYERLGLATLANRRITLRERTPDALAQVMATERPGEGGYPGDGERVCRRRLLLEERLHDGRADLAPVPVAAGVVDDRFR